MASQNTNLFSRDTPVKQIFATLQSQFDLPALPEEIDYSGYSVELDYFTLVNVLYQLDLRRLNLAISAFKCQYEAIFRFVRDKGGPKPGSKGAKKILKVMVDELVKQRDKWQEAHYPEGSYRDSSGRNSITTTTSAGSIRETFYEEEGDSIIGAGDDRFADVSTDMNMDVDQLEPVYLDESIIDLTAEPDEEFHTPQTSPTKRRLSPLKSGSTQLPPPNSLFSRHPSPTRRSSPRRRPSSPSWQLSLEANNLLPPSHQTSPTRLQGSPQRSRRSRVPALPGSFPRNASSESTRTLSSEDSDVSKSTSERGIKRNNIIGVKKPGVYQPSDVENRASKTQLNQTKLDFSKETTSKRKSSSKPLVEYTRSVQYSYKKPKLGIDSSHRLSSERSLVENINSNKNNQLSPKKNILSSPSRRRLEDQLSSPKIKEAHDVFVKEQVKLMPEDYPTTQGKPSSQNPDYSRSQNFGQPRPSNGSTIQTSFNSTGFDDGILTQQSSFTDYGSSSKMNLSGQEEPPFQSFQEYEETATDDDMQGNVSEVDDDSFVEQEVHSGIFGTSKLNRAINTMPPPPIPSHKENERFYNVGSDTSSTTLTTSMTGARNAYSDDFTLQMGAAQQYNERFSMMGNQSKRSTLQTIHFCNSYCNPLQQQPLLFHKSCRNRDLGVASFVESLLQPFLSK